MAEEKKACCCSGRRKVRERTEEEALLQRLSRIDAMMVCPVIVCCFEGVDAVQVVRTF